MFIEYKVKFGQDGITVTQCIDVDAVTIGEDEVRGDQQAAELETGHANVAKENRLSRAAPLQRFVAIPAEGSGPGDSTRGSGPGDSTRGSGPGDSTRGSGPGDRTRGTGPGDRTRGTGQGDSAEPSGLGDSTRGAGQVIVLGPVIINCPRQHK